MLLLLLLLLMPALLTHAFVPAVPSWSSSSPAVVGKPAARTPTIDGHRPLNAPALRLYATPKKRDDEEATTTATSTSSNNGPIALAALTKRVRALLGQCVTVSLMLLAQFRPVSPISSAMLGAPQGMYKLLYRCFSRITSLTVAGYIYRMLTSAFPIP